MQLLARWTEYERTLRTVSDPSPSAVPHLLRRPVRFVYASRVDEKLGSGICPISRNLSAEGLSFRIRRDIGRQSRLVGVKIEEDQ
jgi:hypothetical protein